ncbi:MAG: FHA domain-containing protein [Deltaproteobacteria bacterium]|nr:FHA domain-containing protein [Deltaproteobacteria bacterium]
MLTVAEMRSLARQLPLQKFIEQLGPFALVHQQPTLEQAQAAGLPVNAFTTCVSEAESVAAGPVALLFAFEALTVSTLPPLCERDALVVGRQPDSDLVVEELSASKRHAVIRWDQASRRCTVEDLGSSNGTFVNGRRVRAETPLNDGDIIGFGEAHYWFLLAATLHARLSTAPQSDLLGSRSG